MTVIVHTPATGLAIAVAVNGVPCVVSFAPVESVANVEQAPAPVIESVLL